MSQDMEPFTEAVTTILQEALHAMWLLVEEANADVIREREAARKAIEEAPPQVIKETSEDTEKFNSLTSEVEALKASLQSERQATEDLRNAFSEAEAKNLEMATKLENVTRRVDQLCESASLQSEQQAAEDLRKALSQAEARNSELTAKLENVTRRVDQLCESESQEVLVKCISQNLGYDGAKPVVACVIYKCLLHWRSFEVARTNIFDRIVKIIASAIEVSNSNEVLAYWLSNSAMLVCLLQRTFRSSTMPSSGCISPWGFSDPEVRIVYWQRIVGSLRYYLKIMKANNVPPFIVSKVFTKIFSFINIQLFNSLLLRHECRTINYGKHADAGLAELRKWCVGTTDEYVGSAWDELRHIRQAVAFLVTYEKPKMTLEEVIRELCPVLSIRQLYTISTMYRDDSYGVSYDVKQKLRFMVDSNPIVSSSFLLADDSSSIPFAVDDISKSMEPVDVNDIELSQLIHENPCFSFLLTPEEGSPS
ncbi:Dilute domain [Arabidopsis thaliana x Arabidopsis arenosa]|uniref:Dilute domain n=1 Tax=Arabidopsis thaliana x Arabidopsis arenosa TaxID=1240361 RepID=A0A8T1YYE7_9BRAS|nr:Dilute domain [Arabidopsis thaliana x Arabidopsis arenosa]